MVIVTDVQQLTNWMVLSLSCSPAALPQRVRPLQILLSTAPTPPPKICCRPQRQLPPRRGRSPGRPRRRVQRAVSGRRLQCKWSRSWVIETCTLPSRVIYCLYNYFLLNICRQVKTSTLNPNAKEFLPIKGTAAPVRNKEPHGKRVDEQSNEE